MPFGFRFVCGCGLVLLAVSAGRAVEVQQEVWGFDGNAVIGAFNPLSVYVYNGGEEPFEGAMVLRKGSGVGPLGARLVEPLYLSPGTGRWVTFYPYITSRYQSWELSWGRRRGQRKELAAPPIGERAAVYLWTDRLARPSGRLRAFDASRFPATVGATDGLRAVVLDAAPDWSPPQRKAFVDWLYAGGEVHLLSRPGADLSFRDELAELNSPLPTFRVGAGVVHRHPFTRAELNAERLIQLGLEQHPVAGQSDEDPGLGISTWPTSPLEQMMFQSLQKIVRPEHNWTLIYLASLAFLLLVGPINGWLSRRRIGYRGSLAFVGAAVLVFSYGFYTIGRRGYGEETSVHKVAYARALPGGYDVLQYANAFVTRGDEYRITHPAQQNLYATAQNHEPVRGMIRFTGGGAFDVEIPVYSWRSFVHRGLFAATPPRLRVLRWPNGEGPAGLEIEVGEGFPKDPVRILALRGESMAPGAYADGRVSVSVGGQSYRDALNLMHFRQNSAYYQQGVFYDPFGRAEKATPQEAILPLIDPLIASRLGVLHRDATGPLTGPDRIILLVVAPAPPEFSANAEGLKADHGFVVYHFDLSRPEPGVQP